MGFDPPSGVGGSGSLTAVAIARVAPGTLGWGCTIRDSNRPKAVGEGCFLS